MTKLDVSEFPDGGRATLVRRYSPPLTRRQLDILQLCSYDRPAHIPATQHAVRGAALVLVRLGLLERNPDSRDVFRQTAAGQEVLQRWQNAGLAEKRGDCANCSGRGGGVDEDDQGWTCLRCNGTGRAIKKW